MGTDGIKRAKDHMLLGAKRSQILLVTQQIDVSKTKYHLNHAINLALRTDRSG